MDLMTAAKNAMVELQNVHKDLFTTGRCPCADLESLEACPIDRAISDLDDALSREGKERTMDLMTAAKNAPDTLNPLDGALAPRRTPMTTLREAVELTKCRKGKSVGTTKRGAYWLACDPIVVRRAGGDGIGQSAPDITWTLELRHFRGGEVRPTAHEEACHQNGSYSGAGDQYFAMAALGECASVEEVIVALKGGVKDQEACYSDRCYDRLRDSLVSLGLPESAPGPDDRGGRAD